MCGSLSIHCVGHSVGPLDLNTCVFSPGEGFHFLHLPSSLSGTPISPMLCLDHSFMSLVFLIFSISWSFCCTFWEISMTSYFNLAIEFFISAVILLLSKSSLFSYLQSKSWFSWLHHLLKDFCKGFENYCLLPELAPFPLESVLPVIYLMLPLSCCKVFFSLSLSLFTRGSLVF